MTERPAPAADSFPLSESGRGGDTYVFTGTQLLRFGPWGLRRDPEAMQTVYTLTCLTEGCKWAEEDRDLDAVQHCALKHAGRTNHRRYAEDMRTFFEALPLSEIPEEWRESQ